MGENSSLYLSHKVNEQNKVNTVETIPSYEVANMMERPHWKVLNMIEGKAKEVGIIDVLTDNDFVVSDYFIESYYKDESGKTNKSYECTKLGCDLLANKMTGKKGILFSARYVKKFNQMQEVIQNNTAIATISDEAIKRITEPFYLIAQQQAETLNEIKRINLDQEKRIAKLEKKEEEKAKQMQQQMVKQLEEAPTLTEVGIKNNEAKKRSDFEHKVLTAIKRDPQKSLSRSNVAHLFPINIQVFNIMTKELKMFYKEADGNEVPSRQWKDAFMPMKSKGFNNNGVYLRCKAEAIMALYDYLVAKGYEMI